MKTFTYCNVSKFVYDFFVKSHGSDYIVVKSQSYISSVLRHNLTTVDTRHQIEGCFLRIELPHFKGINIKYRRHISIAGQKIVNDLFDKYIRELFFNFMVGWCLSGQRQKDGVIKFLEIYNLENSSINYDRLIKSWNRSDHKLVVLKNNNC